MDDAAYKLDEIAERAGVSPRTVRYYVQRGLLPAPTFRGKDSAYGAEHLARLRAIKRLQEQYLPLDTIQSTLTGRSVDELERIADGREAVAERQIPQAPPSVPSASVAWEHHALAPGLELHLASDATDDVRALATQLMKQFRPPGRGGSR